MLKRKFSNNQVECAKSYNVYTKASFRNWLIIARGCLQAKCDFFRCIVYNFASIYNPTEVEMRIKMCLCDRVYKAEARVYFMDLKCIYTS